MFASPLSTVSEVIRTQSAASIYAPLTFAQVANCGTWTMYGLGIGDSWVWGPNTAGLLLGIAQLGLKIVFPSKGQGQGGGSEFKRSPPPPLPAAMAAILGQQGVLDEVGPEMSRLL